MATKEKQAVKDPFEDDRKEAVKSAERGTFIQETMKGQEMEQTAVQPLQGQLQVYPRLSDYQPGLSLVKLEEVVDTELLLWRVDFYNGESGEFATMELSLQVDPEQRFLCNCGGENVKRALKSAFAENTGPFAVEFYKVRTSVGREMWCMR